MNSDPMTESGVRRGFDFFKGIEEKIDHIVEGQGEAKISIALIRKDIESLQKGEGKFITKTTLENCMMRHAATCKNKGIGWKELVKIISIAVASAGAGGAGVASLWGG